jgi:type IV pilus assembly protein PilE
MTCFPLPGPQPRTHHHHHQRAARGFTLIEMLVATAVTGILSSVAYPSYQGTVQKVRRTDALVAVLQVQAAQERWRSNNAAYGSLAEIRQPAQSAAGHYALELRNVSDNSYELRATARGAQGSDNACRTLKLVMTGLNAVQSSGPDATAGNDSDANRRCWGA